MKRVDRNKANGENSYNNPFRNGQSYTVFFHGKMKANGEKNDVHLGRGYMNSHMVGRDICKYITCELHCTSFVSILCELKYIANQQYMTLAKFINRVDLWLVYNKYKLSN